MAEKGSKAMKLLHPTVRQAASNLGYKRLLPVQEKAIPVILSGRHTIIVAPTGSGKTEAALLPILSMMVSRGMPPASGNVRLVYVTPLRALNRDLEVRISRLAGALGYTVMVRHGDTPQSLRREFKRKRPDIVITTPESLGLLISVHGQDAWSTVRWIVVDEIHELVESKRGVELALNIEKLNRITGGRLQRIGLSATLSRGSLEEAKGILAHDRFVAIVEDPSPKRYDIRLEVVEGGEDQLGTAFWSRAVKKIAEIVRKGRGSILIFTNTRSTAEHLAASLTRELGMEVPAHHGSLSRHVREAAERRFREGDVRVLVATSSLELGIDIGSVSLVIQFMSPRQVIAMTQRAGRAGHSLHEISRAIILTPDNVFETLESGVIGFRAERGHLEDIKAPRNSYDALAHFATGSIIDGFIETVDDILDVAWGTMPYQGLTREEANEVLRLLSTARVLRFEEDGRVKPSRRTKSYYFTTSMIPDERSFTAVDIVSNKVIGELSERFVQFYMMKAVKPSDRPVIVLAGKAWQLLDIDLESGKVMLSPMGEVEGYVPVWEGEIIPVDWRIAREVCGVLAHAMIDEESALAMLRARKIPVSLSKRIIRVVRETNKAWKGVVLSERRPVIESYRYGAILYACLGSKGNFALALLLSKLMESGEVTVSFEYIPYAIVFTRGHPDPLLGRRVADALKTAAELEPAERAGLIYDAVRSSRAYLIRFYHVARRMGLIDQKASVSLEVIREMAQALRGSPVDVEAIRELVHDKLDLDALNRFLDGLEEPVLIEVADITPLAREVLTNPYMKRDVGVSLKKIGKKLLIEAKKRALRNKRVLFLCTQCLYTFEMQVADVSGNLRCPKCGMLSLAPLPPSETGKKMVEAFREWVERRGRVKGEKAKLSKEVQERAYMYLTLAGQGLGRYAVEALSALGVGPRRARPIISALMSQGEDAFYEEIIRAEEEYAANRRYWKK